MKFLLVNDDGYGSVGIKLLEKALSEFGEVFVVGPMYHQSGKSCGLIFNQEVEYKKYDDHHYAVNDLPTGCVVFGLFALNQKIDIVFSGINDGENVTLDTSYSGTIGACHQALFSGVPSVAVSTPRNFDMAEAHIKEVLQYVFDNKLYSRDYILNINFPYGERYKGIKYTTLHFNNSVKYEFVLDDNKYAHTRSGVYDNASRGTDVYAIHHSYCSFSAISPIASDNRLLKKLKNKVKK